jgi:GH25 family lysozyme M1 (1,4-beta-N-acetylmuramidase)
MGFDASKYQSEDAVKARLADPGIAFGIIAATTGASTVSSAFPYHSANLRASGKLAGFYHWLIFEQDDAIIEAGHFWKTVQPRPGELMAADIEQLSKRLMVDGSYQYYIPENALPFTLQFLREFGRLSGFKPYAYLNLWWLDTLFRRATPDEWAELTSYPLWLAHYTGTPGVYGNSDWGTHDWEVRIHQFTDKDSAGMDGDWFNGGPSVWAKYATPKEA